MAPEKPSFTSSFKTKSSNDEYKIVYASSGVAAEQICTEESTYRDDIAIVESMDFGSSPPSGTSKKIWSVRIIDEKMDTRSSGLNHDTKLSNLEHGTSTSAMFSTSIKYDETFPTAAFQLFSRNCLVEKLA